MRRPLADFEQAARQFAKDRGRDPEELTFFGDPQGAKRPIWVNFAEALRSHWEKNELLKEFT
jgi:hypothetical protein